MLACLLLLSVAAGGPTMEHGVAPTHSGCVIAAPHEGFDEHTAPIARGVAKELQTGWVVATGYRRSAAKRWLDVNRPTQRAWKGGRFRKGQVTPQGKAVYGEYQRRVDKASGRAPLDLLVEIHGHGRRTQIAGKRVKVQVIELATRGFSTRALRRLQARYRRLVAKLPVADRVQLAIEQLDPTYVYQGKTVRFYFRASGSKKRGSLRAERAKRILHFELPSRVRFQKARREKYTALFSKLLRPLVQRTGPL